MIDGKRIIFIGFTGSQSTCAEFAIDRTGMKSDEIFTSLHVKYEGDWTRPLNNPFCWPGCKYYEDAQSRYGFGLAFERKVFLPAEDRTLFVFRFTNMLPTFPTHLVVPVNGEELKLQIYGVDREENATFLYEMES